MSAGARWPDRRAVLFDLDGTLADTAADLCAAANLLRRADGLPDLPLAAFRPWVSRGGRAMLDLALAHRQADAREAALAEFLALYGEDCARHTALFPGMERVLQALERAAIPWGVVTNKPVELACRVLCGLGLEDRCRVLLGGDSLPRRKPDPLPLQAACERLGVAPGEALYVGDDERDMQAARACGMPAVAAAWGYLPPGTEVGDWMPDGVAHRPEALLDLLGLARGAARSS